MNKILFFCLIYVNFIISIESKKKLIEEMGDFGFYISENPFYRETWGDRLDKQERKYELEKFHWNLLQKSKCEQLVTLFTNFDDNYFKFDCSHQEIFIRKLVGIIYYDFDINQKIKFDDQADQEITLSEKIFQYTEKGFDCIDKFYWVLECDIVSSNNQNH